MINMDLPCVPVCWVPAFSPNQMTTIEKRTFQNSRHWKSTGKLHSQSFLNDTTSFFCFLISSPLSSTSEWGFIHLLHHQPCFFVCFFLRACSRKKERKKKEKWKFRSSAVCLFLFFQFLVARAFGRFKNWVSFCVCTLFGLGRGSAVRASSCGCDMKSECCACSEGGTPARVRNC